MEDADFINLVMWRELQATRLEQHVPLIDQ